MVADELGYHFVSCSSASRYGEPFRSLQSQAVPHYFSGLPGVDALLFTLAELCVALAMHKDETLGPKNVSYQTIRHHPLTSAFLLSLYNFIWVEGVFSHAWSTAIVSIPFTLGRMQLWQTITKRPNTPYLQGCGKIFANSLLPTMEKLILFLFEFGFLRHRSY